MRLQSNAIRFRYVLVLLVGLVLADGVITEFLVHSGLGKEGNPVLKGFLATGNLMTVKIVGVLLSVLLLASINQNYPRWAAIVSWSFILIYTFILYWNLGGLFLSGGWS
jgi:Domain of unknown function (DUF5658)